MLFRIRRGRFKHATQDKRGEPLGWVVESVRLKTRTDWTRRRLQLQIPDYTPKFVRLSKEEAIAKGVELRLEGHEVIFPNPED